MSADGYLIIHPSMCLHNLFILLYILGKSDIHSFKLMEYNENNTNSMLIKLKIIIYKQIRNKEFKAKYLQI